MTLEDAYDMWTWDYANRVNDSLENQAEQSGKPGSEPVSPWYGGSRKAHLQRFAKHYDEMANDLVRKDPVLARKASLLKMGLPALTGAGLATAGLLGGAMAGSKYYQDWLPSGMAGGAAGGVAGGVLGYLLARRQIRKNTQAATQRYRRMVEDLLTNRLVKQISYADAVRMQKAASTGCCSQKSEGMNYKEAIQLRKQAGFGYDKDSNVPLSARAGVFLGNTLGELRGAQPLEPDKQMDAWLNAITPDKNALIKGTSAVTGTAAGLASIYGIDRLLRLNSWLRKHELLRGILSGSLGTGVGVMANNFTDNLALHAIATNALYKK